MISLLCGIAHATVVGGLIDLSGSASVQSSNWPGYDANGIEALDGNLGNFTHTGNGDASPTWSVDFGMDHTFDQIIIHNRDSCCADRLADITVQIFDSASAEIFNSGVLNPGGVDGSPAEMIIDLGSPHTGRAVVISRDGTSAVGGTNVLAIGEFQIKAFTDELLLPGTDLTRTPISAMAVSQTTTLNANYAAGNGVDGNFGNFTHTTSADTAPAWEVDFGEEMSFEKVEIFNRGNCCGERLRDITVEVLDGGGTAVFTSELLNPENALGFAGGGQSGLTVDLKAENGGDPITGQTVRISRTVDPTGGTGADDAAVLAMAEVTVTGSSDLGGDIEPDGMPDNWEINYGLLVGTDDSAGNPDNDGLTNVEEFNNATNPNVADTDEDGLNDGPEVALGSDPLVQDTDGDGLLDGAEVNGDPIYGLTSDPTKVDTDGDEFSDPMEVSENSDPNDINDVPNLTKISDAGALLGGDITDPENDGVPGPGIGAGFNWVNATASSEPNFGGQAAFDVFDNSVAAESKWCCAGGPQNVTVEFAGPYAITHFTMTSAADDHDRDPVDWAIQGSNDGVTWTNIYPAPGTNDVSSDVWTSRVQTMRFDLPAASAYYSQIRYQVNTTGGVNHQLAEIEYFGMVDDRDADSDGMPDWYENSYDFLNPNDDSDAAGHGDADLLTNLEEYNYGSDPGLADTDNDGLNDDGEQSAGTNPRIADTDADLFPDGLEVDRGSLPLDPESVPVLNPITFALPQNITGMVSDIDTSGFLVAAYNGGTDLVTVGGIAFNPGGPSLGNEATGLDPFDRLGDLDYETLLDSASHNGTEQLLGLTGLTPGEEYLIQIWVADTRGCCPDRVRTYTTDTSYIDVDQISDLESGVFGDEANYPGQFVIGTFTAASDSQYMLATSLGASGPQFNAIMVRQTTGAPEVALDIIGIAVHSDSVDLTVRGFDTTKQYQLMRSTDLQTFGEIGTPFTPAAATDMVSDPSPDAGGKGFYKVELVP